jgi:TPR repeat protein
MSEWMSMTILATTQWFVLACLLALLGLIVFAVFDFKRSIAKEQAERRSAISKLTVAAVLGDVNAQLALAWEYARGDVVEHDIRTAWNWFERAASSGEEEARVHRARFLQLRQVPEGVRELRDLAQNGNWKAQFWLGQHYQWRAGRLSKIRAAVWYDRSAKASGNRFGELAKLGQLFRIARFPWKIRYAIQAFLTFVAAVRHPSLVLSYETLLSTLRKRRPTK